MSKANTKRHPLVRISKLANERANEIVTAFQARGIETSKAQVISELILSMPIPQPVEKKSRTRKVESISAVGAAL